MVIASSQPDFAPAGFFALRTPLLPYDEFLAWSDQLEAVEALADPTRLEPALARDRARLRDRLHAAFSRPAARDALFVASPDLDEVLDVWLREPESKKGQRIELALVRYFERMAGRATPFGLFAGASVGTVGDETRLVIAGREQYQRHTRLDMDYLFKLTEALGREPEWRNVFRYRPNSSLYRLAGRVRYVESRLDGKDGGDGGNGKDGQRRAYHLVAVDDTPYLAATLALAREGATFSELAAALVEPEITLAEAESYIAELIASQVLVPDLALPVTGDEPIHPLIEQCHEHAETAPVAHLLNQVRTELAAIDAAGLGANPERYRALARELAALPAKAELPRLFQVDLIKPAPEATLGGAVLDEITHGVKLLHRLSGRSNEGAMAQFIQAFTSRYEQRAVLLVEALDEELGIGFPPREPSDGSAPLLKGLAFPGSSEAKLAWGRREAFLLDKLSAALAAGSSEIVLEERDLKALEAKEPPPMPDAFEAMVTIVASSEEALTRGEFRVAFTGVTGPSGARLLGRFCHADPMLREHVERHLRAEESLHPEAVFAEIVHLPEGRIGNVISRPVLRDYEIRYLGQSGAPSERQIPITDFYLSVRDGRAVLHSLRLGCEVIPRLTNAHNYALRSLGIYKFLCALQSQKVSDGLSWSWGALQSAPFLPRVVTGRLVLSPATWRVSKEELKRLGEVSGATRFQAVQQWRAERRLPRWIALADGDNTLPVDLDNVLSIEAFVHVVKERESAALVEVLAASGELCARGPEGRFVHELIVPFVRKDEGARIEDRGSRIADRSFAPHSILNPQSSILDSRSSPRRFSPGSEWLYAKLYTGAATAEHVLREVIAPLTEEALRGGATDRWFFIRYSDPDWHVRLRLHGDPQRLRGEVLPALHEAVAPLLEDGRLWRVQLDTYEREVERYGGAEGIELAERIFQADSEAVIEISEMLEPGDAGLDERWRLALRGLDLFLDDLGFDLEIKLAVIEQARQAYAKEFRANEQFIGYLGDRFRQERKSLEALLDSARELENPLSPGLAVLRRRSECLSPIIAELKAAERRGRLSAPPQNLALSYLHMHANRLLRSAQRAQEVVIYDYLARLYQSQAARARKERQESLALAIA